MRVVVRGKEPPCRMTELLVKSLGLLNGTYELRKTRKQQSLNAVERDANEHDESKVVEATATRTSSALAEVESGEEDGVSAEHTSL